MNVQIENLTGVTITADSGKRYRITEQVGCGAQGVVYKEKTGLYMVKFYYPSGNQGIDEDICEKLLFIKNIKMPPNFVAIVDIIKKPYVGYVMERVNDHNPLNSYLIPDINMPFSDWYNRERGLYGRIYVGYIIAKAFGELEKSNLSYCDISGNNILIKVDKGASVKMIDIDNIYIAGKGTAAVIGTPRYIAPEIISRHMNPDVLSDNYSLAVILFELLRVGHPYLSDEILDGSPEEEDEALSGNAEYVTDENSKSMLPADVVLTEKLKDLFHRCFVDGKKNRLCRPSATEFEKALLEASNKLIKCPSCGAWHYPRKKGKTYEGCPWCDNPSRPSALLNFFDILFDGSDYRKSNVVGNSNSGKLVNSYILKDLTKNYIKSLYILRSDNFSQESTAENYLTIAHGKDGKFHVYNEFDKDGIVVKKYMTNTYIPIGHRKEIPLSSGDEIYFEMNPHSGVSIECGGLTYSFIRMARFTEVQQ